MSITDSELKWLAGLSDAEACFGANIGHGRRKNEVAVAYHIGLVREDVMREVHRLVQEIAGDLPDLYMDDATGTKRAYFHCSLGSKDQVLLVAGALLPMLQGKRLEAQIVVDILRRSTAHKRYVATSLDRELCVASQQIKRGTEDAAANATRLLGGANSSCVAPGLEWLAGMFDGDGCVSMSAQDRGTVVYHQPAVNFKSSDLAALTATRSLVEALGYRTTAILTQEKAGNARPANGFNVAAESAERFLVALRPHLRVKAVEADVALDMYRGVRSREQAYFVLRALKHADEPAALLERIDRGEPIQEQSERCGPSREYRRATHSEMMKNGWMSASTIQKALHGVTHGTWTRLVRDLPPVATIGNKSRYYDVRSMCEHVRANLYRIRRGDVRERLDSALVALAQRYV